MLEALAKGHTVTHTLFGHEEWMKAHIIYDIEFEDGCVCSFEQFWSCRQYPNWDTGWTICKGATYVGTPMVINVRNMETEVHYVPDFKEESWTSLNKGTRSKQQRRNLH